MSIKGKVVLVTGGTSGIGARCTKHFAEQGAHVVFGSNQNDEGRALEAELHASGLDAHFVLTDVTNEESIYDFVDQAVYRYRRVDAVHCNAGVWRSGKVTEVNDADWDLVMGVNVRGVMNTLKYVVPEMEKVGQGVIVITTSV